MYHPRTPDVKERISKRRFDGKVRAWRRALHSWDDIALDSNEAIGQFAGVKKDTLERR